MRRRIRPRLTYANVMSTIAVFVALGGSSYAAVSLNGKNIKYRSVSASKIKRNTLTNLEIRESRLGTVPKASVAEIAESADSLTERGADALLRCPDGMVPAAGTCIDVEPRGRAAYGGALLACSDATTTHLERRLPTHGELVVAFTQSNVVNFRGPELTSDVYPSATAPGKLDVLFLDGPSRPCRHHDQRRQRRAELPLRRGSETERGPVMASLRAHFVRSDDHDRLSFHAQCPRCRAARLEGDLTDGPLVPLRVQAALAVGVLACTSLAPTAAFATGVDDEIEGTAAPGQPTSDIETEGELDAIGESEAEPTDVAGQPTDTMPADETSDAPTPEPQSAAPTVPEPEISGTATEVPGQPEAEVVDTAAVPSTEVQPTAEPAAPAARRSAREACGERTGKVPGTREKGDQARQGHGETARRQAGGPGNPRRRCSRLGRDRRSRPDSRGCVRAAAAYRRGRGVRRAGPGGQARRRVPRRPARRVPVVDRR